ncbi:MAG: phytoene/squalene synthase family protein [Bryobacterales bacterium]|nr:phytoene/squalene synthase family protein [Bryobacterales bacterium]
MRPSADLEREWRRRAAEATARGSKSFYFATRFFPEELAASAHAVYWFCRTTDDIVDENPDTGAARVELEQWREGLRGALRGATDGPVILRHFAWACARHGIPAEYAFELIEGMRMDLEGTRYRDFEELRVFCYRVASTVGLMMSHVIGYEGDALPYAEDLGVAMQLTNILRDVGEDLGRGRIYLPAEEMERFGYGESELRAGRRSAEFVKLMAFQAERARDYYARSMPGIGLLRAEGRFAVEIAARVYRGILNEIEAMDYDVFRRRAVVPAWRKYGITARALAGPAAGRLRFWRS